MLHALTLKSETADQIEVESRVLVTRGSGQKGSGEEWEKACGF
jgi:hypothetical protein